MTMIGLRKTMSDEDEHVCHDTNADNEMMIMMIVILPTTTGGDDSDCE